MNAQRLPDRAELSVRAATWERHPGRGACLRAFVTAGLLTAFVGAPLALGPSAALAAGEAAAASNRKESSARVYVIKQGDSLISIGEELLERPEDWAVVRRLNRIGSPRQLRPGQRLFIPFYLLKGEPDVAIVENADPASRLDGQPIKAGAQVRESSVIETGDRSVVTLRLSDGSSLRLEPASRLRLERLRRYHGEHAIEARVLLEQGRIETSAATGRRKPLSVRTPVATAAVRGTEFRVSASPAAATTEVLGGSVWWGDPAATRTHRATGSQATRPGAGTRVQVDGGFGSRADAGGPKGTETLLAPPDLSALPARVERPLETMGFPPVPGAVAYRVDISRDEGATDLVSTIVTPRPSVSLASRDDGAHFVQVRPIAASQIEGRTARATVDVEARPFPPAGTEPPDQAVVYGSDVALKWSRPEGTSAYELQIAATPDFATPLTSGRVTGSAANLDLKVSGDQPLTRYWRIASVDAAGRRGPFIVSRLQWRPDPKPPEFGEPREGVMALRWPAREGERYVIELASTAAFVAPRRFEVTQGELELRDLAPGHYFLRMQSVATDGLSSPFSPPQAFDVKALVTSGGGTPLRSGSGLTVESPLDF